jgi:hypothetical protein
MPVRVETAPLRPAPGGSDFMAAVPFNTHEGEPTYRLWVVSSEKHEHM